MSAVGGDRTITAIMTSMLFLGLPAFGWVLYNGFTSNLTTIFFNIPNTPFSLKFGVNFVSLFVLMVSIMFTVIALLFVLQVVSGAKILGSGMNAIGGTLIVTIIQWTFGLTIIGFLSAICLSAMSPIPFDFGLWYVMVFSIIGFTGLALNLKAAGT